MYQGKFEPCPRRQHSMHVLKLLVFLTSKSTLFILSIAFKMKFVYKTHKNVFNQEIVRLNIQYFDDGHFELLVFHKNEAWTATIAKNSLQKLAENCGVQVEEYYKQLQDFFCGSSNNNTLTISLENDQFSLFYMKMHSMKFKYFTWKLNEVDFVSSISNFLDNLHEHSRNIEDKLEDLTAKHEELCEKRQATTAKLEEFLTRKKTEDQKLFENFTIVLNEKKRYIQHLRQQLESFNQGVYHSTIKTPVNKNNNNKKKGKKKIKEEVSSESSTEADYSTEEEPEKEEVAADVPGPSGTGKHFLFDEDDEEIGAKLSTIKRSRSNRENVQKDVVKKSQKIEVKNEETIEESCDVNDTKGDVVVPVSFNTQELLDML